MGVDIAKVRITRFEFTRLSSSVFRLMKIYLEFDYNLLVSDKTKLATEKAQLEQDKSGIKEELIKTEQEKLELDVEKSSITHNLEMAEMHRSKLENELTQIRRERVELIEKLNGLGRQRTALQEELQHQKQELERCQATIIKLLREKEGTNKELIDTKHDVRALGLHIYFF